MAQKSVTRLQEAFMVALIAGSAFAGTVTESARDIPVAYEVDVVVVGGSTGAVSAAVAAAESGAKVFLAAPRPYLGDDMCASLRLWLEAGETPASPLAKSIFSDNVPSGGAAAPQSAPVADPNAVAFIYTASLPSAATHADSKPPSKLTDGLFGSPNTQSVQYNGDVTIMCDAGKPQELKSVRMVLFHRDGSDFVPETVTVRAGLEKNALKEVGVLKCGNAQNEQVVVSTPINAQARYVEFAVKRADAANRVLIGEIVLVGPGGTPQAAPPPAQAAPAAAAATACHSLVRPMHVKKTLDESLLAAKVNFLYGCGATDVLRDADGKLCGIVMANRSGRQAVLAKTIIDATPRAAVARMAGVQFTPYPAGEQTFERVVVGGGVKNAPNLNGKKLGLSFPTQAGKGRKEPPSGELVLYSIKLPMPDVTFKSFAAADNAARDLTFDPQQVDSSEFIFQVPPDQMKGAAAGAGEWKGAEALNAGCFKPAGLERLYVLSGCADLPREHAAKLLRPLALIDAGTLVGKAAAAEAKAAPAVKDAKVAAAAPQGGDAPGDVKEFLNGLRPTQKAERTISSPARALPVIGVYDVVVIGGGTGGAPAGIGAARGGAKALVVEYLHGLGGVGTLGLITLYYHGYRGGFTAEVDKGVKEVGAPTWAVGKPEYWRRANRQAGAEVWCGVLGCGAFVENNLVKGAVVVTPDGRGVILAKTVIDSTGNADVAAAAGAACTYTAGDDVGVQGAGLPPITLGADYTNTDWSFADDTDVVDFWLHYVTARNKFKGAYDLGQLVDTRERRRIVGDATVTPMDIILGRRWPDSVVMSKSNFDSHGFTVHPIFVAMPPDHDSMTVFVPLRALLPKGFDGILVTGLGVSAHRDAMPVIRMQPDVQNQGYACGYAAAMVAKSAATIRQVDLKSLQKHLVEANCLPEKVLEDKDSLPMPKERVAEAVAEVAKGVKEKGGVNYGAVRNRTALAIIFAHPQESVPLLEAAYGRSAGDDKLAYAHILAMLGSKAGADTLVERIKSADTFDKGWDFKGMGQFGRSLSELDSYIVALGRTRDPRTLDIVLDKLKLLDASKEFSHHRGCALALEMIADPRAAGPLAELLAKPGMTGHVFTDVQAAKEKTGASGTETKPRNDSLRELTLARALFRCGDKDGVGRKILEQYAQDLRGHYARHAQAVLAEQKTK
jgi:hypothetical protein